MNGAALFSIFTMIHGFVSVLATFSELLFIVCGSALDTQQTFSCLLIING